MTITYPVPLPEAWPARSCRIRRRNVVGVSESVFTGGIQTHKWSGEWWELEVALTAMAEADFAKWQGFLASLQGRHGTFLAGPPGYGGPYGVATGTPVVDGASQTGYVLETTGWTPSQSGILLSGTYFQLGSGSSSRLHRLTQNADSDGSGNATLDFWPALRSSPSDGAPLTLADPKTIFRLGEDEGDEEIDVAVIGIVAFSAREDLPQ